jgi:ATP-binding cassette subfamily B protein
MVSHRLASIRNADRVLVLADGRIAESGAFDALMSARGRLFRLVDGAARRSHA